MIDRCYPIIYKGNKAIAYNGEYKDANWNFTDEKWLIEYRYDSEGFWRVAFYSTDKMNSIVKIMSTQELINEGIITQFYYS